MTIEDETEDRQKPVSIADISGQKKSQPTRNRGVPTGIGNTGISMGRAQRQYNRNDEDTPNGETVGARSNPTRR